MVDISKRIEFLVKNWDKIPDDYKTDIRSGGSYSVNTSDVPGLPTNEHTVVLLLDRQKPSVERSYDFDEERISVSRTGKVVWGFDSGCSCPSPWHDNYPECYTCSTGWKEFELNLEQFDHGAVEEVLARMDQIKAAIDNS